MRQNLRRGHMRQKLVIERRQAPDHAGRDHRQNALSGVRHASSSMRPALRLCIWIGKRKPFTRSANGPFGIGAGLQTASDFAPPWSQPVRSNAPLLQHSVKAPVAKSCHSHRLTALSIHPNLLYARSHLRRCARTPALERKINGVGGNGAAMQTGDPQGRECSHLGYAYV